ncbi:MAG: carbohydrate porin [Acidocella sp.]|nr:carbohydrate porin [Acidocella sp.]
MRHLTVLSAVLPIPALAYAQPAALANAGITIGLQDSETLLGAVTGGVKQGATLQGTATATLDIDTAKAFALPGGTIHISALQIHGRSLSPYYLADLQTTNGYEAEDTTRLWELWYDQSLPGGRADIKFGAQSIDNEFIVSQYSGLFVNTMAGWPMLPSADLYGGGPAYPLAALGIRLRAAMSSHATALIGVFDDNPGGGMFTDDAQTLDENGTRFNLNTGALFIAELQVTATPFAHLPGTYKAGLWYDTATFPDQRFGNALPHHGNVSLYGVIDQTIWRSATDTARKLNFFARVMAAPAAQNLIDRSINGGLTLASPLPGRDSDQAGLDIGIAHVSAGNAEALFELTYQAQATPWLVLQPDLQFIINPGAGIPDPADPAHRLSDEIIAGIRSTVTF